jgi:hypothetical protein
VPDEIHDLVKRVVRNPDAGQGSPSVFLRPRARQLRQNLVPGLDPSSRRSLLVGRSGCMASSARRRPRRSRTTPAASGRRLWAASPIHRRASKSERSPADRLRTATFSSGVSCFRCFFMRSLHYLTGRTPSPFPAEPEHQSVSMIRSSSLLSTRFRKYGSVSQDRSLTVAAPIRATSVRDCEKIPSA